MSNFLISRDLVLLLTFIDESDVEHIIFILPDL